MALFTSPPSRRGEHHFERARAAELRGDFAAAEDHFRAGAEAFDAHFADVEAKGRQVRPAHLVMAGICYTRLGRNEDALSVLDRALAAREIPTPFSMPVTRPRNPATRPERRPTGPLPGLG